MLLAYSPREVCSKLGRKPPPAALARRWKKVEAPVPQTQAAAAHAHSTQPASRLQRADVLPTLPLADELVQPPFACQPAECWIVHGGEHGIFVRGYETSPSMKGCSLCMLLRCVRAARASARDICSTLPARCDDRRIITRSVGRMYLLCFNALRDAHRVLTRRFCAPCRIYPSSRHGRAVPEAAGKGTRV